MLPAIELPRALGRTAIVAALAMVALLFSVTSPASAAPKTWADVADEIGAYLTQAAEAYDPRSPEAAKKLVDKAYFGPFEADGMEATIKTHVSASRAFELEQEFKQLKMSMGAGKPVAEVVTRVDALSAALQAEAKTLDGEGASGGASASPFLQSFGILLREGFEAILILGAILAYLRKSGNKRGVRTVQLGALAAIAASVVMAVVLSSLFAGVGGFGQEVLEGATMLLAMVVLFWVSYWLAAKARAQKWQEYIQDTVARTATKGSTWALASVAFLAVFREGGETILFYAALVSGNPGSLGPIALGFAAAAVVLVALYAALRWGSLKIPFKPFFVATSALLFYLAFVFAGQGVRELQEAGLVGVTRVPGVPVLDIFGIYPTAESLLLQATLLVAAVGGALWQRRSPKDGEPGKFREVGEAS